MKKKKGFTLVELLAVIVILAIILVIAVPQIMDTIDSARKASLESSAKMVAAQVENQYTVSQTLGTNFSSSGDCTTAKWAGLNDKDYESCTYSIDSNGKASVTLVGKGKFEGKSICDGTRTSAKVTEESCGLVCAAGTTKVLKKTPYEVENAESCEDYLTQRYMELGWEEYIDNEITPLCGGGMLEGDPVSEIFEWWIVNKTFTEQELIDNNVINNPKQEICATNTDESCFAFDNGSITGYDLSCGTDVVIPSTIGGVNVTAIGDYAFTNWGVEVTSISNYKDVYPSKLNTINHFDNLIPIDSSPEGIGITSVVIPEGITEIGNEAFNGNKIGYLTLPSSVVSIGNHAFYYNLISDLDLPSSIVEIEEHAFDGNPLVYVDLKNSSAYIGASAFGCQDDIATHNLPSTYNHCR